jgi:HAMP domain-containing protein
MRSDVPVDLTREQARQLAEVELADPAYRAAQPGLVQRAIAWVIEQVQRVIDRVAEAAPGGWLGILGLVTLIVVAVLFLRWRLGPVARSATVRFEVDPGTSAARYRARAAQRAANGDWSGAVTERMRALVRQSQERGLIDGQPGWTADEVAAAVASAVPGAAGHLDRAARTFDDVRYGGRPATAEAYATIAAADDLVERARPAAVG